MLCQIFIGPQFQNFTLKCGFLAWRRASENVDSYPKMGTQKILMNLEPTPWGKVFFYFLKAKNKEKLNTILFFLCPSQKPFCPFWGSKIKCLNIFIFEFSSWRVLIEVNKRYVQIFKVHVVFKN